MCGICGFNWDDKKLINSMSKVLTHRGQDNEGSYTDEDISLGHRRLSIIDLSSAGKQPMCNEEGAIWITFNGEIYNFKELRTELENQGHKFKSNTDTEVIVHGYEEWGEKVVGKLNGQFAFAIWNSENKKLFLARDRLGIKPLYYHWDQNENKLIFASEIKAILLGDVKREVNLQATRDYLQLRYIPGKNTMFQGINKILPGQTLVYHNKEIVLKQYWDLPLPKIRHTTLNEAAKTVNGMLTESINKRLIADVPVGIYLSGGIDSAAITALASKVKKDETVKTFSAGFNYNDKVDELSKARKVSEHFNTDHHEIIIDESISQMLPKLIWNLDMPHGDPVIIPLFKLSQLASKKVKVVLSGEGADEIFAGYVQYKNYLWAQKIKKIPFKSIVASKMPIKLMDQLFDYPSSIGDKGKEKLVGFLNKLNNKEESYRDLISITSDKDKKLLFTEKIRSQKSNKEFFQKERQPLLNQLLYYDTKRWLPNYVLHINDRMTMANSIEGRTPFLDHKLVEYSTTLPPEMKLSKGRTKLVLRESMKNILPKPEVKKQPFFMPLDRWYKEELKDLAEQLFTPALVKKRGLFNHHQIKKIWENYNQSKLIYGKQLFTVINLELWQRMFIDSNEISTTNNIKLSSIL